MSRIKLMTLLVLALLAILLVLQNTQALATRLLFITLTMPLAALLALTLLIGFAGGTLSALKFGRKTK